MSSLGPNEPYPEEGQMADLRAFIAGSVRRHPDWLTDDHLTAARDHFGPECVTAMEDHTGEDFDLVVADLLDEID